MCVYIADFDYVGNVSICLSVIVFNTYRHLPNRIAIIGGSLTVTLDSPIIFRLKNSGNDGEGEAGSSSES